MNVVVVDFDTETSYLPDEHRQLTPFRQGNKLLSERTQSGLISLVLNRNASERIDFGGESYPVSMIRWLLQCDAEGCLANGGNRDAV